MVLSETVMLLQLTGSQITETYLKEYSLSGRAAERTVVCTWRLPRRRWSMFNLPQDSKRHFYCRREISSPVSTFVSVRLCRLSSLHFNFYTFLKSESMQQTQRLPIFYFLLIKICHLHYWWCSLFLDTISVNSRFAVLFHRQHFVFHP